jgi:glucose-6-phosphate 1-dehydrogenase
VIQNHALQVLALIGMEPPSGNDPDSIRDKKLEFFKAMRAADLEVLFEKVQGEDPEPYERLLGDAIAGNHQLFTRQSSIEETWRVVQPLLDEPGPVLPYEQGTWGPKEAEDLLRGTGQWSHPWLPSA